MENIIIDEGGVRDKRAIQLATRKNRWIPNVVRLESPPARLNAAVLIHRISHPNAQLRSLTSVYNCMGLVFAARRTWIGISDIDSPLGLILEDDGYRKVEDEKKVMLGDVVVYKDAEKRVSHVGVVAKIDTDIINGDRKLRVMSQWGADGEYIHDCDDLPMHIGKTSIEFWTERKGV